MLNRIGYEEKRTKKSQNTCVKIESSHYVHVWCITSWIVLRLNLLGGGFFIIKSRVGRFRFVLVAIAFFFRLWFVEASSFSASSATPPSPLFTPEMLSCKKKKAKKNSRLTMINTLWYHKTTPLRPFFWRTLSCGWRKRHPKTSSKNCSRFPFAMSLPI